MTARDVAESTFLLLIGRLSMAAVLPALGLIAWLGTAWLDGRFDAQASATQAVVERVKSLESNNLPTRLSVLESTIVTKGAARDQQINQMAADQADLAMKVDKLQDTLSAISNNLAALNATLTARDARP